MSKGGKDCYEFQIDMLAILFGWRYDAIERYCSGCVATQQSMQWCSLEVRVLVGKGLFSVSI